MQYTKFHKWFFIDQPITFADVELISPNYPYGYPSNLDQRIRIQFDVDEIIKLKIIDFYIQNDPCQNDSCPASNQHCRSVFTDLLYNNEKSNKIHVGQCILNNIFFLLLGMIG